MSLEGNLCAGVVSVMDEALPKMIEYVHSTETFRSRSN